MPFTKPLAQVKALVFLMPTPKTGLHWAKENLAYAKARLGPKGRSETYALAKPLGAGEALVFLMPTPKGRPSLGQENLAFTKARLGPKGRSETYAFGQALGAGESLSLSYAPRFLILKGQGALMLCF